MKTNTDKIKLISRYYDEYYLTPINDNEYKFEGDSDFMRVGYNGSIDKSNIEFIDPSGGPMLQVGNKINNKTIEKIEFKDYSYVLTLK